MLRLTVRPVEQVSMSIMIRRTTLSSTFSRMKFSPVNTVATTTKLTQCMSPVLLRNSFSNAQPTQSLHALTSIREYRGDSQKPKPENNRLGMLASLGIGASFLMGKTKYALVALKLTKAAPLASMVLTSFAYSFFFGWPYAVGMVGLIFCHECGHAIVMHRYGVPFSPMVFVPFMGAVIAMNDRPMNSYQEAMIAFGGPVLGSAAALATGTAGVMMESQLLIALADFGYMINLFNLLPVGSMDGGRIGNAISPYVGVVGLVGAGAMIYNGMIHNPIFYLIVLSGAYSTGSRLLGWDEETKYNRNYYHISNGDQSKLIAGYVALVCALLYAMKENNKHRKTPKQLEAQSKSQLYGYSDLNSANEDGLYDDYFGERK